MSFILSTLILVLLIDYFLDSNRISDEGAIILAKAIGAGTKGISIKLGNNIIGDEGIVAFGAVIKGLVKLNLSIDLIKNQL